MFKVFQSLELFITVLLLLTLKYYNSLFVWQHPPNAQDAEAEGAPCVPGQTGLHNESLNQKI